jgi:hypothetical protein
MKGRLYATLALTLTLLTPVVLGLLAPLVGASSHREAPLIARDPSADGTDFYMFRSPDKPDTVTFIANYIPLQPRYGGPNFHHPADEVRYAVKIDNNGDAEADIVYQFRFWSERRPSAVGGPAGDTYLYNDGPISSLQDGNLLYRQYYELTRTDINGKQHKSTVVGQGQVVPAFIGKQSYCEGIDPKPCTEATAKTNYEMISASAVSATSEGGQVFVGPRQEAFYVDLGKVFDLARLGTLGFGTPSNDTAEFNVTTLAIQTPISKLTADGDPVIGAWTTASRQSINIIGRDGQVKSRGPWMQISRLGSPLVNEVVIGAKDKDKFNASEPKNDVKNFGDYVVNPRIVKILNVLYGLGLKETGRGDLVQAFVSGIPGVNRPAKLTVAGEMLRLNTAIPVTDPAKRSDLGILGVLQGNLDAQGFPNGRRVTDDVTDAELSALTLKCNGVDEGFGPTLFDANGQLACTGIVLGDGVDKSGLDFRASFPYLPTPHSGTEP